ncbi:MAG: CYTH domain-containing protein [Magnetococcus sp. DMHC-6]
MGLEIERRFLVQGDGWRGLAEGVLYRQGFLSTDKDRVVRVRMAGEQASLTIKGATQGITKHEFEYAIPLSDAQVLLNELCLTPLIEKTRYRIAQGGVLWEVDEFAGDNQGLILAEVELTHAQQELFLPEWIGKEISLDPRYFNSNLVQTPYIRWKTDP